MRRFLRLLILTEVGYQYVCALAGKRYRHSAADAGISPRNESNASIELSIAAIGVFPMVGERNHFVSKSRPLLLLVGKRRLSARYQGIAAHLRSPVKLIETRSRWNACTGNIPSWKAVP